MPNLQSLHHPEDIAQVWTNYLIVDLLPHLSDKDTIRETACLFCSNILKSLTRRYGQEAFSFCGLLGYMHWEKVLKLKGAAGWSPRGANYLQISESDGIVGETLKTLRMCSRVDKAPKDLQGSDTIFKLDDNQAVSLLTCPAFMQNGRLVFVLALGVHGDSRRFNEIVNDMSFQQALNTVSRQLAILYNQALGAVRGRRAKKYLLDERVFSVPLEDINQTNPNIEEFFRISAEATMGFLNEGNLASPYYRNYLFYEYQENEREFVLRSYSRPKYEKLNFSMESDIYENFVKDGKVKSIESQTRFVKGRGNSPCVIRFIENKIEVLRELPDENWSPANHGSAFFVPLFNRQKPLGLFVFLSGRQNRRYTGKPTFYSGEERRRSSLNHLKSFRSLQPILVREYMKLKLEGGKQTFDKLEDVFKQLKKTITLSNPEEALGRLAALTTRYLNCEGCIIYLNNNLRQELKYVASAGFRDPRIMQRLTKNILGEKTAQTPLPQSLLQKNKVCTYNGKDKFRSRVSYDRSYAVLGQQLRSKSVHCYMGYSFGRIGVLEVYNSHRRGKFKTGYFDDQDRIALRQIGNAFLTVVGFMEASADEVQVEKEKVTQELLLDISHELKNPLYASRIFASQLSKIIPEDLNKSNPNIVKILGLIEENTVKAQNILKGMQNLQNAIKNAQYERVDLGKIAETVLQTNQIACREKNIALNYSILNGPFMVLGDKHQLNQVFTNLLTNAMDAMPHGGELDFQVAKSAKYVEVTISDTGEGISDDLKKRIFDPYVTTKDRNRNSGLGLALCRRIVLRHDGQIRFESEPNTSTTFVVQLPHFSLQNNPEEDNEKQFTIH